MLLLCGLLLLFGSLFVDLLEVVVFVGDVDDLMARMVLKQLLLLQL